MTFHSSTELAAGRQAQSDQNIGQTIKEAVDQATREAVQQVRDAQQEVRDAQQEVRDAQQGVREAQQQLRSAHTADQRGAANQAMQGAQEALRAAENGLRRAQERTRSGTPMVYAGPPRDFQEFRSMIPSGAVDIAIGFFVTCAVMVIGLPISRALGRRFERRGTTSPALEAGVSEQLERIEQAVEAMAIEVERISESQRYLTKLQIKAPTTVE